MEPVNPRGAKVTDEQIRADLQAGLKPADIARKHGVSRAAVSQRVKRLELTTQTAVAPVESQRFVRGQVNAVEQLLRGLERVNLLMDACDAWLRDADDPSQYDIGARSGEVEITYEVEVEYETARGEVRFRTEKRKRRLSQLMATLEGHDEDGARYCGWKQGETRFSDPRELILKTTQEARSTVGLLADLARTLADAEVMQQWREVVLNAIGRADPETRDAIRREVESSLVLRGLLDGPAVHWNEVN